MIETNAVQEIKETVFLEFVNEHGEFEKKTVGEDVGGSKLWGYYTDGELRSVCAVRFYQKRHMKDFHGLNLLTKHIGKQSGVAFVHELVSNSKGCGTGLLDFITTQQKAPLVIATREGWYVDYFMNRGFVTFTNSAHIKGDEELRMMIKEDKKCYQK